MEKNYMPPDALVEMEFVEDRFTSPHAHENPELLFVLEGMLHIKTDRQEYTLSGEDFILINAERTHSYTSEGDLLAVRFQLSAAKIHDMLKKNLVLFWCCSVLEKTKPYEEMRQTLKEIILSSVSGGEGNRFYLNSLYYRLLSQLCGSFLLKGGASPGSGDKDRDRMDAVLRYIRANYRSPISLQEVADELFLSPTYLSKFVKKSSGQGFVDLISSVRLSHAVEDLMYTDLSVTRIAMDNGFPSVAALNKAFRDTYDTTPSEYRKTHRKKAGPRGGEYAEKTALFLQRYARNPSENESTGKTVLSLAPRPAENMSLSPIFNAGSAKDLLNASAQRQILYARDVLGIRHIRFWNLLDPEMYLDSVLHGGKPNFRRLDELLDFFVSEELIPYIELRPRSMRIYGKLDGVIRKAQVPQDFAGAQQGKDFFDALFNHLVRRYGRGEVNRWYFGYAIRNDTLIEDGRLLFTPLSDADWDRYLEEFEQIAASLKRRFPEAKLGGASWPVQHYGADRLAAFFGKWSKSGANPDFISITSYPYQIVNTGDAWYERRRTDLDFVKEDVEAAERAVAMSGLRGPELHVAECNLTLSDRSYINDSLMRGAFAAEISAAVYGRAAMLGLRNGMDSSADLGDTTRYLFGGSGILTKTGAAKPPAAVLDFMRRLYRNAVYAEEGCLVSVNEHRHYKILVHHLVNMNTAYYLKEESEVLAPEIGQMAESAECKSVQIRLEGIPDGGWQVRKYSLSASSGSILDEWLNLDMDMDLTREEQQYLERVCVPRLFVEKRTAEGGVLEFDTELLPNEVQFLHITEFN